MLFCKKCSCSGIGKIGDKTFAKICPRCKRKNCFVKIPGILDSFSVENPHCYILNGTKYLVTSGKGRFMDLGIDAEGIYTLLLADSETDQDDALVMSFMSINPGGLVVISASIYYSELLSITINECSGLFPWKKINTTMNDKVSDLNNRLKSTQKGIYAKKITIYADGRTEEEDISDRFHSLLQL